ncbi:hypothetical protein ElyMa_000048200 [Elysia marginata]|uniref:Uncharacterized protein n=1 Tax=Elysia marginata TaxID=1093978 RepID=A0AAV4EEL0_9GAST|nr:hypothetical protein ElyMa_000048200 [Elysia marginata]
MATFPLTTDTTDHLLPPMISPLKSPDRLSNEIRDDPVEQSFSATLLSATRPTGNSKGSRAKGGYISRRHAANPSKQYLTSTLGNVLASCMAELCLQLPEDPIEFMAHWLYRYADFVLYTQEKTNFLRRATGLAEAFSKEHKLRRERMHNAAKQYTQLKQDLLELSPSQFKIHFPGSRKYKRGKSVDTQSDDLFDYMMSSYSSSLVSRQEALFNAFGTYWQRRSKLNSKYSYTRRRSIGAFSPAYPPAEQSGDLLGDEVSSIKGTSRDIRTRRHSSLNKAKKRDSDLDSFGKGLRRTRNIYRDDGEGGEERGEGEWEGEECEIYEEWGEDEEQGQEVEKREEYIEERDGEINEREYKKEENEDEEEEEEEEEEEDEKEGEVLYDEDGNRVKKKETQYVGEYRMNRAKQDKKGFHVLAKDSLTAPKKWASRDSAHNATWQYLYPPGQIVCLHPLLGKLTATRPSAHPRVIESWFKEESPCQSLYNHELYVCLPEQMLYVTPEHVYTEQELELARELNNQSEREIERESERSLERESTELGSAGELNKHSEGERRRESEQSLKRESTGELANEVFGFNTENYEEPVEEENHRKSGSVRESKQDQEDNENSAVLDAEIPQEGDDYDFIQDEDDARWKICKEEEVCEGWRLCEGFSQEDKNTEDDEAEKK